MSPSPINIILDDCTQLAKKSTVRFIHPPQLNSDVIFAFFYIHMYRPFPNTGHFVVICQLAQGKGRTYRH